MRVFVFIPYSSGVNNNLRKEAQIILVGPRRRPLGEGHIVTSHGIGEMSKRRINFEANDQLVDLIETLQRKTGASKKGVIVGSLLMMKWALEQNAQGLQIAAISEDGDSPRKEFHSELVQLQEIGV